MCLRLHAQGRCRWRRTLVPGRRSSRRGGTAGARSFSQNRARQGNYKARRDRRILRPSRSSSVPPISPQAAIATVASAYALSPFTLPAFSTLTVADFGWAIVLAFAETKTSCRSGASWPAGSRGVRHHGHTSGACQAERRCSSGRPWREAGSRPADEPEASYAEPIGAQPPAVIHSGVSAR